MADRAKKVSELTSLTAASGDDLLLIVDDPSGTPATKKITVDAFFAGSAAANGAFANLDVSDTATVNNAIIANAAITDSTIANVAITDTSIANVAITDASIANAVITDTTITTENVTTSTIGALTVSSTTNLNGTSSAQNLTISNFTGSTVILNSEQTPTSNPLPGVNRGTFFWDENYLYIAFSDTHIKRVALESFFFLSGTLFENENVFFTGSIATV